MTACINTLSTHVSHVGLQPQNYDYGCYCYCYYYYYYQHHQHHHVLQITLLSSKSHTSYLIPHTYGVGASSQCWGFLKKSPKTEYS